MCSESPRIHSGVMMPWTGTVPRTAPPPPPSAPQPKHGVLPPPGEDIIGYKDMPPSFCVWGSTCLTEVRLALFFCGRARRGHCPAELLAPSSTCRQRMALTLFSLQQTLHGDQWCLREQGPGHWEINTRLRTVLREMHSKQFFWPFLTERSERRAGGGLSLLPSSGGIPFGQ